MRYTIIINMEIINLRPGGGIKRTIFQSAQNIRYVFLCVYAHPSMAMVMGKMTIISGNTPDAFSLPQQLIPQKTVIVVYTIGDNGAGVAHLDGEVSVHVFKITHEGFAPLRMAVDGELIVAMRFIEKMLKIILIGYGIWREKLILLIGIFCFFMAKPDAVKA